jgi:hypothetical protein
MRSAIILALCLGLAACSGSTPAEQQPPPDLNPVDPATVATLNGQAFVDGTIPPAEMIRMDGDPKCAALVNNESRTEFIVSSDGKTLANVFVYVKEGLAPRFYPVPTEPVVFDQQQCRYVPRVLGLQVGQPLEIRNSDPLLHNVRGEAAINQTFDLGQPIQGMKTTRTFTTREVMIPIKCQVHAWMRGYIGVLEHPYFAVTDENGRFTIPNLPAGTYTLEAWHEQLGTQTQQVTLAAKDAKTADFTFKVS